MIVRKTIISILFSMCALNAHVKVDSAHTHELSEEEKAKVRQEAKEKILNQKERLSSHQIPQEQKDLFKIIAAYNRTGNIDARSKIKSILDPSNENKDRGVVVELLKVKEDSIPLLIDFIKSETDEKLRGAAILNIRSRMDVPAVSELMQSLVNDPNESDWVKNRAQIALGSYSKQKQATISSSETIEETIIGNQPAPNQLEADIENQPSKLMQEFSNSSQNNLSEHEPEEETNGLLWAIIGSAAIAVTAIVATLAYRRS